MDLTNAWMFDRRTPSEKIDDLSQEIVREKRAAAASGNYEKIDYLREAIVREKLKL